MNRPAGAGVKPLGIYIHIPFCVQKCGYCDFLSFSGSTPAERQTYVDGLVREIRWWGDAGGSSLQTPAGWLVDTVFFGGGTPSLLSPDELARVLRALEQTFYLAPNPEISLEANPGTFDQADAVGYRAVGFNRISLGVQSFSDELLAGLGRIHRAEAAKMAIRTVRTAGFDNINIDLMFGIPGQTQAVWESTLEQAFELNPDHLSFYSLEIMPGTPLAAAAENDEISPVSAELDRKMYHQAWQRLEAAGYMIYEISNAARPGRLCRHNLKYWTQGDYLGIGLGAHSYVNRVRFYNAGDRAVYSSALAGPGRSPDIPPWAVVGAEQSPSEEISDFFFTGLRLTAGLDCQAFADRFGARPEAFQPDAIQKHLDQGWLEYAEAGNRLRLTEKGRDVMNQVLIDLI